MKFRVIVPLLLALPVSGCVHALDAGPNNVTSARPDQHDNEVISQTVNVDATADGVKLERHDRTAAKPPPEPDQNPLVPTTDKVTPPAVVDTRDEE